MKRLLPAAVLVMFVPFLSFASGYPDLKVDRSDIEGQVQSVEILRHMKKILIGRKIETNENGDELTYFYGRTLVNYNRSGDILNETDFDNTGAVIGKTEYVYDQDGILRGETYTGKSGEANDAVQYFYDENGFLSRRVELVPGLNITRTETCLYDVDNHLISITCKEQKEGDDEQSFTWEDTYSADGRLVKRVTPVSHIDYTYVNGDLVLKEIINDGEVSRSHQYEYLENRLEKESIATEDPLMYCHDNDIIAESEYFGESTQKYYEYDDFDDHGNWTYKREIVLSTPPDEEQEGRLCKYYRTITYY